MSITIGPPPAERDVDPVGEALLFRQGNLVLGSISPERRGEDFHFLVTLIDCLAWAPSACPNGHPGEDRLPLYLDAATLHSYPRFQRAVLARFGRLIWDVRGENGPHSWREVLRGLVPS